MKNIGAFFRCIFGFLAICGIGLPIVGALNLWMLIANYLSLALSFEMLGLDTVPLGDDKLLGPLFAGIAGEASLVNLIAASLACVVLVGFFLLVRQLLEIWNHWQQLRLNRQAGNDLEVSARRWKIGENMLWLGLLLPLVLLFSVWDLEMFRFRAVLGAGQIQNTADAVAVATWEEVASKSADLYAITLAKTGMWGYLAVNLMACFLLEFGLIKARDKFSQITAIAGSWFEIEDHAPAETALDAPGIDETKPSSEPENVEDLSATEPPMEASGSRQIPVIDPDTPVETIPDPISRREEIHTQEKSTKDAREVIGGEPGERVALDEAMKQPEQYFVDLKSGFVWNRQYRENLHGAGKGRESSDAAA